MWSVRPREKSLFQMLHNWIIHQEPKLTHILHFKRYHQSGTEGGTNVRMKGLPWSFGCHGAMAPSALHRSTNQATQHLQLPLCKEQTWDTICHQLGLFFIILGANSTILYGKLDPELFVQSKTQIPIYLRL